MTLTNDEKFALLQDMKIIDNNRKIVELLKKLPFGLMLQHIRDSFSEDGKLMSVEAQKKTVKCIEDLMELQKMLDGEKPQRITSTKEGREFMAQFEVTG